MNYLEIVLQGYFNENNREHLEKFFLREYKKAAKEQFFEADEFFSGCLKVIEGWEAHLDKKVLEQQKELYILIDLAKEGKINSSRQDKTIEQINWETIERCEKKLSTISINDFNIQVSPLIDGHLIGYNLSYNEALYIKTAIQKAFEKIQPNIESLPPQPIVKQKPEPNGKLITFKNSETIEKIHSELKGYFPNKEAELLKALQGEQLSGILLFPHNQNKFVEVFRRLKYNGFLLNTDTEIRNWITTTFQYIKQGLSEPQPFNENTVWNNLNKGKGEPTKKQRICFENVNWLPYKSKKQLEDEAQNEKL